METDSSVIVVLWHGGVCSYNATVRVCQNGM